MQVNPITSQYENAFQKCYPNHKVDFSRANMKQGAIGYWIWINGDKGERPLTIGEIQEATKCFLQ